MANNTNPSNRREATGVQCNGAAGGAYFLAFIGAAVYYIQHANSFLDGVLGFLKALVWPAFLAYGLLEFLGRQ